MGTGIAIVVAVIVVAAIAFLVYGLFQPQRRRPEETEEAHGPRHRWTAQATLADMRKQGAGLPAEAGDEVNRSERPPGADPPSTPA